MKHFFAILSVCLVVVYCQQSNRPPRPPSSMGTMGTPVPMPSASPKPPVSPPRPKGCSPGCGPTEICAELGRSYCRTGVCSVCIKMSSIRFPASALAGMFTQQTQPKPVQPVAPVQPVQVMPPSNPLNTSKNATIGQSSDTASTVIDNKNQEAQISIVEYAAKQRNFSPNDNGNAAEFPTGKSRPPPPSPLTANTSSYQVLPGLPKLKSNAAGVDINNIQDKQSMSTSVKDTTGIDLANMDTKQVKYPIIVTVPEPSKPLNTAAMTQDQNNGALSKPAVSSTGGQTQGESHLGHIDQTQMSKWYLRYQTFKAQQALLEGKKPTAPKQTPGTFDYATFQKFQQWLKLNQQQTQAQDQATLIQTNTVPVIATPVVEPTIQPNLQPIVPVATQTLPSSAATAQPPTAMFNDYNSLQKQYSNWLLQQQNKPTAAFTQQQPVSAGNLPQPVLPVAQVPVQPQNAPGLASMQQQFLQWQQQQQQSQANTAAVQLNPVASMPQPATSVAQTQTPAQSPTFDYAAFQKQYQLWQQNQANKNQAPTTTAAPTVDYSALQQQWQKQQQQQQNQGQNTSNNQLTQQTSSQEIQSNTQQNSQTSQQQNTFSYVPQQPVNNFNNDPFYYNYQQPQQNTFVEPAANDPFASNNNNMMDMMLFSGLGFGGGLFGF
ncbi:uncharacterized protein LOC123548862 isoform X2 [Mercenaria mercenaria]|uniref:uncharacterized protein LOC123548862 isoform X2 n=1 Tax=Mercenaria mercenaria TaxID=6596 RepID=UPI00234FA678|nr:uncharacterized protein LOC123548862 isoform X2 [Mercenaria mercenaria]